ncbi:hypothetical protein MUB24_04960 [Lederbergia sp. NSJ-179]|uniref:tetrahydrofolate dehydrogenase/cyclohydrolase catalytic domain-containing protein n=1 Tax=Lederbergia sp. NSJ-179 TaxID=2931402 RepID=UPI001FD21049|nr:tetrahydrofolate dehydrogenase/cyclohydrolase catalytic domain-containing protein [Lederbergia sp. NSJ-179]MCJ7840273.1 hypothetical protein [Lederbergia sp. NSJ-179]
MNTIILDGKVVAQEIKNDLKKRIGALTEKGIVPCLATILVGNNPASETYVKMKGNACRSIGMKSIRIQLPEEMDTQGLIKAIEDLNNDDSVHGILLQHPAPFHQPIKRALLQRESILINFFAKRQPFTVDCDYFNML